MHQILTQIISADGKSSWHPVYLTENENLVWSVMSLKYIRNKNNLEMTDLKFWKYMKWRSFFSSFII